MSRSCLPSVTVVFLILYIYVVACGVSSTGTMCLPPLKVLTGWGWGTWSSPVLCVEVAELQFWNLPQLAQCSSSDQGVGPCWGCAQGTSSAVSTRMLLSLNIGHCCQIIDVWCWTHLFSVKCLLLHYFTLCYEENIKLKLYHYFFFLWISHLNLLPNKLLFKLWNLCGSIDLYIKFLKFTNRLININQP